MFQTQSAGMKLGKFVTVTTEHWYKLLFNHSKTSKLLNKIKLLNKKVNGLDKQKQDR